MKFLAPTLISCGLLVLWIAVNMDNVLCVQEYQRHCDYVNYEERQPKGWCGIDLRNRLSTTCRFFNKRSLAPALLEHTRPHWVYNQLNARTNLAQKKESVFLPKPAAMGMLGKRSLSPQGIVCECCIHRCSINELRGYCSEVA